MRTRTALCSVLMGIGLFAVACQPKNERPGLWLTGEPAEATVQDWRFTDDVEEIFVETRTWYGLRHSTTIWCVEQGGLLYIGSYDDDIKYWERNVTRNSAARLRIENRIHDVTLTPVADSELTRKLDARYAAKYDMAEVFGDELPTWRYYSVATQGQ